MFATAYNAAIAQVEQRYSIAKKILRDPATDLEGYSVNTLTGRLDSAVKRRIADEATALLKDILMNTLRIEVPDTPPTNETFIAGMDAVIHLIEQELSNYDLDQEPQNSARPSSRDD